MKTINITVTNKAITVKNGKASVEVPYICTAKGVAWFVTKANGRDYVAIGFKTYANGERRANIYLHDYSNKFASLKTLDGKALDTIAKATPMASGKKYTVTNLSSDGLKNFAVMFEDFEKARLADLKASKPTASKASKPTASKASKPTASKASKPTASKPTASKPTASKPTASKPTASKASKPTASKPTASKPTASKPTANNEPVTA